MEFKDLGNGRVVRQETPRVSDPLPNKTVEMKTIADSAIAILGAHAIVGSSADVANGRATHSTLQAAVDAVAAGNRIFVLAGTYSGNTVVGKRVMIYGEGYDSILTGTFTLTASVANFCVIKELHFQGNVSLAASNCFFSNFYLKLPATFTDTGSSNATLGISY